ncbi:MAG: Mu transposase domain-containing protein [Thermoplasmata archaeon]
MTREIVCALSVLHPDLVRLATHYAFTPITAAPADPESKGKVEALVKFVKTDCVPAEGFTSLDEANRWAERWCAEVNGEPHSETCAVPAQRLVSERMVLRPLRERPAVATGERRRVDKFSTVRFASARYSVPSGLRGEWLEVAVEGNLVRISRRGDEVVVHRMCQNSLMRAHELTTTARAWLPVPVPPTPRSSSSGRTRRAGPGGRGADRQVGAAAPCVDGSGSDDGLPRRHCRIEPQS